MGSGKTSVLKARARRLATANPDWKILVLSFNKGLAQDTRKVLQKIKHRIYQYSRLDNLGAKGHEQVRMAKGNLAGILVKA